MGWDSAWHWWCLVRVRRVGRRLTGHRDGSKPRLRGAIALRVHTIHKIVRKTVRKGEHQHRAWEHLERKERSAGAIANPHTQIAGNRPPQTGAARTIARRVLTSSKRRPHRRRTCKNVYAI